MFSRSRWWLVFATAPLMLCGCGCLSLQVWFPMTWGAFYVTFVVENRTDQSVWVTPVGITEGRTRRVLPLFASYLPLIASPRTADFEIPPGESRRFLHDWDDISFSEILVRTKEGKELQLDIDTSMRAPPKRTHYAITDLASLSAASPEVLKAAEVRWGGVRMLLIDVVAVSFVALFVMAVVRAWRGRPRGGGSR